MQNTCSSIFTIVFGIFLIFRSKDYQKGGVENLIITERVGLSLLRKYDEDKWEARQVHLTDPERMKELGKQLTKIGYIILALGIFEAVISFFL
ncbi:MAG: hypothetical protein ACK2T7_06765 [Anaerolineales bacterium]